jgi:hypothetical protein
MELKECIKKIGLLPDGICLFLPESQAEKDAILNTKLTYKGLSLWVNNFVAGEALHGDAIARFWILQPFAEIWKARFDLIVGVHSRCPDFQERGFSSPVHLWYWCLRQQANRERDSIFDGSILQKTEYLKMGFDLFKELNKPEATRSITEPVKNPGLELVKTPNDPTLANGDLVALDVLENPFLAVMLQAERLSVESKDFWDDYFNPWRKAENRALRKIKNSPQTQLLNIIEEQIHVTSQGKNLKLLQIVKQPIRSARAKKRR